MNTDIRTLYETVVRFKRQDNSVRLTRGRIVAARPDFIGAIPVINGKRQLVRVIAYLDGKANSATRRHFWKKTLPYVGEIERSEIAPDTLEITGYVGAVIQLLAHNAIDHFHYVSSVSVPQSVDTLDRRNTMADSPGPKDKKHKRALAYRRAGWNERQRIERTENMTYHERKKANELNDQISAYIVSDSQNSELYDKYVNTYLKNVADCLAMG